jgi:hypothetical protein
LAQEFALAIDGKIHRFNRQNKNAIEMQFDLLGKMDYYMARFFGD